MNKDYNIIETRSIPQIKSEATVLTHKSGVRIIHLKNKDENKVFSVSFKTPPYDDTGLFHIMEHSVLAGSEKYPVKEPFNELIKGSLYTYLNAMTFSDKTMYPIGSCNDKDFYNLMNVYLDAVFFPKIYERRESFLQEAWNFKIKDINDPVIYNGIVYNEMKGAYSDPLRVLDNITNKYLFSGNAYRFDSGGDPDFIPELDYDSFLLAHKKYYHPSNSFIYFYGDMDIDKCLDILHNEYLIRFDSADFTEEITINEQKPPASPIICEGEYSVPAGSDTEGKNLLSASYIVGDYSDAEDYYGFKLLANILLGTPASPVKKALMERDMGEEILGGFDSDILETVFNVTIKNSKRELKDFKDALNKILYDIVKNGIDKDLIQSCINKAEFIYREEDYGYRPKGLVYNIIALSSWIHGGDPFDKLNSLYIIEKIKARLIDENYFENLIENRILNNTNCVYSALKPRQGLNEQKENDKIERLDTFKQSLTVGEFRSLIKQTDDLTAYQNKKDTEQDLMKIPFVELSDIKREPENIPLKQDAANNFDMFYTPLDTNGILYTNMMFLTDKVGDGRLYVIGLLSYLLGKLSTENSSYEELSNKINKLLGGFSIDFNCYNSVEKIGSYTPHLIIKTKCVLENKLEPFRIVGEIISKTLFQDEKRIKDLLIELKSRMQNMFLTSGNALALKRAEAYINESGKYKDDVSGISFYNKLEEIIDNFDDSIEKLRQDLKDVSNLIFNRENFMIHFTCDKKQYNTCAAISKDFYNTMNDSVNSKAACKSRLDLKNEAFATSGRVLYNVLTGDYRENGFSYNGYFYLLSNIIRNVYFMNEIRLKGGAYGFGANIVREGLYQFYSYRDPNLTKTFDVYKNAADFIRKFDANENEMRKHILGAINGLDRYLLPQSKGEIALKRHLCGITYDMMAKERLEVLNANRAKLNEYSEMFENNFDNTFICTIGDTTKITQERNVFDIVHNLGI